MKAQIATFEAMLAAIMMGSAAVAISNVAYNSSIGSYQKGARYSESAYDLMMGVNGNQTLKSCTENVTQACYDILNSYLEAYGLYFIRISINGNSISYGNATGCGRYIQRCMLISEGGSLSTLCFYECGG